MIRLLRFGLLVVLTCLAISLAIAVGGPETGPFEKAALLLALIAIFGLAIPVRHIGRIS